MPLRLAYSMLFLLAIVAFFISWGQVGGQGHLELIPWHVKLLLGLGTAYALVRATAAASSQEQLWTGSTLRWAGILVLLLVGCGVVTYYYHLNEETDDGQEEETVTSAAIWLRVRYCDPGRLGVPRPGA